MQHQVHREPGTSAYRVIRPPRLVEVFESGSWRKGQLEALQKDPHGGLALVRVNTAGRQHPGKAIWVEAQRVRPRN